MPRKIWSLVLRGPSVPRKSILSASSPYSMPQRVQSHHLLAAITPHDNIPLPETEYLPGNTTTYVTLVDKECSAISDLAKPS